MPHAAPAPGVIPGPVHAASQHLDRWAAAVANPQLQQADRRQAAWRQAARQHSSGTSLVALTCARMLFVALPATEYCARGSLYDVLRQAVRSPAAAAELTWRRRVDIALGAARGLLYLHLSTPPILHCDVRRLGLRWLNEDGAEAAAPCRRALQGTAATTSATTHHSDLPPCVQIKSPNILLTGSWEASVGLVLHRCPASHPC